jgi:competence ComEA-like helix-hairpin-helix protein
MVLFKPAEIRILTILALLALAGSALELIGRQGDSSRVDLGLLAARSEHRFLYNPAGSVNSSNSTDNTQLAKMAAVPDAKPADYKIDINHCGVYDIEALPGIGPVLAEKIVVYRDSIGGFKNLDELNDVKGIGPAKFDMIKDRIEIK